MKAINNLVQRVIFNLPTLLAVLVYLVIISVSVVINS